jgi:hypothetical protein
MMLANMTVQLSSWDLMVAVMDIIIIIIIITRGTLSPPSDCQKNGSSSKWLLKQKRPEQESPTSDNQKKEVSSKDQLPYFKDMPTGRKLLQLCPIPPVAHSPVCSTLSSQFP